jgi:MULE transposase domain
MQWEEKNPKTILTDQDPSMRAAIQKVFGSDTVHKCCIWHVLRNARDHLGVFYGSITGFKDELQAIINLSLTISDFEKK